MFFLSLVCTRNPRYIERKRKTDLNNSSLGFKHSCNILLTSNIQQGSIDLMLFPLLICGHPADDDVPIAELAVFLLLCAFSWKLYG